MVSRSHSLPVSTGWLDILEVLGTVLTVWLSEEHDALGVFRGEAVHEFGTPFGNR